MKTTIGLKIENVKTIFQLAKENARRLEDLNELIICLDQTQKEFISVAYEGAAMEIALQDFASGNSTKRLPEFLKRAKKHTTQIYIGLGWAIAQEKNPSLISTEKIDPRMLFCIWDGCGYFDGIFKQRQTIKGQNRLAYIDQNNYRAYDEGMGRSLWYLAKGDNEKIKEMVKLFSEERHSDLWRGIGIACSYVGGFNESTLVSLKISAGKHAMQLCIGNAMVAESRIQAESPTIDMEIACDFFCNLKTEELISITETIDTAKEENFNQWINKMENEILKHNKSL